MHFLYFSYSVSKLFSHLIPLECKSRFFIQLCKYYIIYFIIQYEERMVLEDNHGARKRLIKICSIYLGFDHLILFDGSMKLV
jgi:hypothetical protein